MVDCNENEATGLIINKPINKPINKKLHQFIDTVNTKGITVSIGGRVNKNRIFYIHKLPYLINNSIKINKDLYWGGDLNDVLNCVNNNTDCLSQIKFFIGCNGWGKEQLNNEIQNNNWVITPNHCNFETNTNKCYTMWNNLLNQMGGDFKVVVNFPIDPNYN